MERIQVMWVPTRCPASFFFFSVPASVDEGYLALHTRFYTEAAAGFTIKCFSCHVFSHQFLGSTDHQLSIVENVWKFRVDTVGIMEQLGPEILTKNG